MADGQSPMSVYPGVAVEFVCLKVSGSGTVAAELVGAEGDGDQMVARQGSLLGYRIVSNVERSGGTIRLRFRKNGVQFGSDLGYALDADHPRSNLLMQGMSVDYFSPGDTVGIDVVSANWAPKADLAITLYLAVEP